MVSAICFDGFTLQKDCALCESFEVKPLHLVCIQVCLMNPYFVRHKNAIIMINKFAGLQGKDVFVTEHLMTSDG